MKILIRKRLAYLIAILLFLMAFPAGIDVANAQAPPREKTLYLVEGGRVADPENFNLLVNWRFGWGLHQHVLENLFYINLQTGDFVPWIATGYEYNLDYTKIKVFLRDGVKWSDGVPFTAEDVAFTYNELLIKYAPKLAWSSIVAEWVKTVNVIDKLTAEFVLTKPNPRFHLKREAFPCARVWSGVHIMPKHIWEGEDPLTFKFYPPVGTGPYGLVSCSETTFVYERRDDWWATEVFGIRPAPQYIVWVYYGPEETVGMRMTANEADAVNIGIMGYGTFLEVSSKNPYVRTWDRGPPYAWLDPCPRALFIQNGRYPWSIPEVRRAVSYLIDRDELCELAYEGTTVPNWGPFPFYDGLDENYFSVIEDLIEQYEPTKYDPAKAEKIFKDLGFSKGADGVWVTDNGTRLEIRHLINGDSTEEMKFGAVLADQLTAAGIPTEKWILTGPANIEAKLRGEWDTTQHCLCPGDTDPYDNFELYHSKYWRPLGEPAPWYEANSWRYKSAEYDAVIDELAATPPSDLAKCQSLFKQAMEILFKDTPTIPAVQAPALVPWNTYYWTGWPSAENPWNMPVWWWSTMNLVVTGYESPKTGEWVGGLTPATIDYEVAYFTKDTSKFRGIDLAWYGPFKTGDSARIPADDAEFWIRKGYASYKAPPAVPAELEKTVSELQETVSALEKAVGVLEESVPAGFKDVTAAMADITDAMADITDAMADITAKMREVTDGMTTAQESVTAMKEDVSASIATMSTMLYTAIAIEIVVLAVLVIVLVRRKPT